MALNILVGFAEAFASVESVWSLQSTGMHVSLLARRGRPSTARHIRGVDVIEVTPPEVSVATLQDEIRSIAAIGRHDGFLPLDDAALWLTQDPSWCGPDVAGPSADAATWALDKSRQVESAASAGLSVPKTSVFATPDDVDVVAFPYVLKPAHPIVQRDDALIRPPSAVVGSEEELGRAKRQMEAAPVLLQELVTGTGEGVFGFVGLNGADAVSGHRRVRMVNPQGSASSACESVEPDQTLVESVGRLMTSVGWKGEFMVELLRSHDGTPWFMEVNGRAWGSMALARRRGFEYPAWTVQSALCLALEPPIPCHAKPVRCRHIGREILHVGFVARGPQSSALQSWPRVRDTVRDLAVARRDDRFYNWDRSQPSILALDTWYTVREQFREMRCPQGEGKGR